jgi:hypothetical protein
MRRIVYSAHHPPADEALCVALGQDAFLTWRTIDETLTYWS